MENNFNKNLLYLQDYDYTQNNMITRWANSKEILDLELEQDWQGTNDSLQRTINKCRTRKLVNKVVYYEDRPTAAFMSMISSKDLVIDAILVSPEYRGLNIAQSTIEYIIKNYKELFQVEYDIDFARANVKVGNESAKKIFENVGFKFDDVSRSGLYFGKYRILKQNQTTNQNIEQ